jgi:hypothetical protein
LETGVLVLDGSQTGAGLARSVGGQSGGRVDGGRLGEAGGGQSDGRVDGGRLGEAGGGQSDGRVDGGRVGTGLARPVWGSLEAGLTWPVSREDCRRRELWCQVQDNSS